MAEWTGIHTRHGPRVRRNSGSWLFGIVVLAGGDWLPGGIIVAASTVGLAREIPIIRSSDAAHSLGFSGQQRPRPPITALGGLTADEGGAALGLGRHAGGIDKMGV
jgi:hypothetical protein